MVLFLISLISIYITSLITSTFFYEDVLSVHIENVWLERIVLICTIFPIINSLMMFLFFFYTIFDIVKFIIMFGPVSKLINSFKRK
jgi:hypothetical protein